MYSIVRMHVSIPLHLLLNLSNVYWMFIGVKWIIATWSRISINTDVIFTQHAMDYATMRMRHLDRMLWYLRLGS